MHDVTFNNVIDAVAQVMKVPRELVMDPAWNRDCIRARHLAMYIMKQYLPGAGSLAIGVFFSVDPNTVTYGVHRVKLHLIKDEIMQQHEITISQVLKLQGKKKCRPHKVNNTPVTKALKR